MRRQKVAKRHKSRVPNQKRYPLAVCIGAVLLDLSKAVRKAEKCRRILTKLGFSHKRWQEIVNDVDPDFRFMVRPRILDAILVYLHSVREPMSRESLIDNLNKQSVGTTQRIRHSITINVRSGKLIVDRENKIGLPEWNERASSGIICEVPPPIPGGNTSPWSRIEAMRLH